MQRHIKALLLGLLVLALLVPAAVAPVAAAGNETATVTTTTAPANATATSTTDGGPAIADQARITAVSFDKDYLRVERQADGAWNTTGPYVVFASSQPIEAARITQPKAEAKVLDGGQTVRVAYAEDAATGDASSLYTLELFFADGSKRSVQLYAGQTDQIVASAEMADASGFIEDMKDDAEDHGFPATIDGIQEYHSWEKKQADLFTNLFGPQFEKLFAWLIVTLTTPFALILLALVVVLAAWRMLQVHGSVLRALQNGVDLVEQSRRQMHLAYRDEQDAADEERLEDLDEIGPAHIYWSDGRGINSVKQLADEFAFGRPRTDDHGNIVRDHDADPIKDGEGNVLRHPDGSPVYPAVMEHRGVEDLRGVDSLRETWLEPMLRPDMLGDPQTALSHAKRALMRMTTHYGQPQYRPARRKVKSMLENVRDAETPDYATAVDRRPRSGRSGGSPMGGDD